MQKRHQIIYQTYIVMGERQYEQIKLEIAENYIQKFKNELGWFKSLALLPVESKIKKIMISKESLEDKTFSDLEDLWRWRTILWALTPKMSNDIFDFLKQKQSLIVQAETEQKLEELRNEVVLWQVVSTSPETTPSINSDQSSQSSQDVKNDTQTPATSESKPKINSAVLGVGTWVTGATAWKVVEKSIHTFNDKKLMKQVEGIKMNSTNAKQEISMIQNQINKAIEQSKTAAKNPKFSRSMRKNLENSSKKFWEVASSLQDWEVIEAWDARWKLGRDMPEDILNALDPKSAKKFAELDQVTIELISKSSSTDEIAQILEKKWITIVDKKIIQVLADMQDVANIQAFAKVLRFGKKLSPVIKGLSCFGALDVAFFGFDVWMWKESMNEAEYIAKVNEARASIKKNKAYFELAMWAASIVLELWIILTCSWVGAAAGSIVPVLGNAAWLVIGLAVGAFVFTVQELVNQLYYDKKEYLAQNKEDYLRQERTGIKQAILQCTKDYKLHGNKNIQNDLLKKQGITTLEEAWKALIIQEELEKYQQGTSKKDMSWTLLSKRYYSGSIQKDFEATLSAQEKQQRKTQWASMDKEVASRMKYVQLYMTPNGDPKKYQEFMASIDAAKWIAYIEKIVGESDVYREMHDSSNEYLPWFTGTVEAYTEQLGKNLQQQYPKQYKLFETIYTQNAYLFEYICTGIQGMTLNEKVYTPQEYTTIQANHQFIRAFYHYKMLWHTKEHTKNISIAYTDYDYAYLERILINIDEITKRWNFNEQEIKQYFSKDMRINSKLATNYQVSSSTGQNIIYRMAREIHGYSGNNTMGELMSFYSEASDDTKGIYYDNKWNINNDENTFGGDRWYNKSWKNPKFIVNWSDSILGRTIFSAVANRFSTIDKERNIDAIDKQNMSAESVYAKFENMMLIESKVDIADQEITKELKNKIKTIISEEIASKSPAYKKQVEQKIKDFVTSQSKMIGESAEIQENGALVYTGKEHAGYVELPYELVIEAKKAKLGEVEKFLYKYEQGKIVAITSQVYTNSKVSFASFPIVYERITPLRQSLTPQEAQIISKVDEVKNKLSRIRSVESRREDMMFGGLEDELNIPIALEREMTQKVYERENLKQKLLYVDINESKNTLLQEWNNYYAYFNDTYIGMLATISQFTFNDNLGNHNRMSQVWTWIGKEKYQITKESKISFDHLPLEKDEKKYLLKYIQKAYQWEKKTVEKLLLSSDSKEKEKGEWMLNQIMVAIFESEVLSIKSDKKNIQKINQNWDASSSAIEEKLKISLGPKAKYISVTDAITTIDESKIVYEDQKIVPVHAKENEIYTSIQTVTNQMIATMNNVDRWHGRKNIRMVVNDKETTDQKIVANIQSRDSSHKIYIDIKHNAYYIEWLNHAFTDSKEFAYTVNFLNRAQGYYLKANPEMKGKFFFGDGLYPNTLFADQTGTISDIDILKSETVKKYFTWLTYKNIDNRKMFIKYINTIS